MPPSAAACSIGGSRLEKTILAELFAVLEPASLDATAKALAEADDHYRQRMAAFELAVERARYEAERAWRQYDAVEPENRLVARTLERAWEDKLAAVRQAENDLRAQQARRPVPSPATNSPGSPRPAPTSRPCSTRRRLPSPNASS